MKKLEGLSAFFPAFNEEGNIGKMVDSFGTVLPEVADDFEIIIVNDGSTDKTGEIADRLLKEDPKVRVVHHEQNLGYGTAIRSGLCTSRMEYIFFTDGDSQFDVSQLSSFVSAIYGFDGVIGFRVNRQDPWVRKLNAWAWNRLVRLLFGLRVRDIDCAFKLFRRGVFEDLQLESAGAMISTEMLVKIKNAGFRLREMGVLHSPRMAGKQTGANFQVILRAFKELFRFYGNFKETKG